MDVIVLKNISKKYDDAEILKNISLGIGNGEFVTLMGPSGSGKSTLLYIMGGLEIPTKGIALFNGHELNKLTDKQKSRIRQNDMGFIFQFYNLVQNLTVEENILLPAVMSGKKKKDMETTLNNLLGLIGLEKQRRKVPSKLSGGQQQLVAVARAVVNNPKVILADEPTGNLDTVSGTNVMEMLKNINKTFNTTVLHVTHNPDLIHYGTRLIKIKDGQIVSDEKTA